MFVYGILVLRFNSALELFLNCPFYWVQFTSDVFFYLVNGGFEQAFAAASGRGRQKVRPESERSERRESISQYNWRFEQAASPSE